MTKKSNENSIHSSKTSYDKVIRRMEKQETHILNSPTLRISDNVAEQIKVQQPLIQAFQPLQDAMQSYHDLMEQNSLGFTDETASPSLVTQTLVSKNDLSSKTGSLSAVDMTIHPYRGIKLNSDFHAITASPSLVTQTLVSKNDLSSKTGSLSAVDMTIHPYRGIKLNSDFHAITASPSLVTQTLVSKNALSSKTGSLSAVDMTIHPYRGIKLNSDFHAITASPSLVTQTLVSKNDLSSKTGSLSAVDMTIHPYRGIKLNSDFHAITASPSLVTQTLVSKNDLSSKTGSLSAVDMTIHPYRDIKFNSDVLVAFESAMITPELKDFRSQFESNVQTMGNGLSVVSDYVGGLTSQWDDALALNNVVERSIAAQNFAVVRMLPNYDELKLPRGGKKVLKSLTKTTAKKLMQSDKIQFDPKEKFFSIRILQILSYQQTKLLW